MRMEIYIKVLILVLVGITIIMELRA